MLTRTWSPYQQAIFSCLREDDDNIIVEAVAGSGKSTTIIEGINVVAPASTLLLAFNKAIAEELKAKGVNARTFHSLTYSAVTRHLGIREIDPDKLKKLITAKLPGDEAYIYGSFITRLVSLGKQTGVGCLIPNLQKSWIDIINYHDMELDNELADIGRAIELAGDLLHWSNTSPTADFDDLLYLAVKEGLTLTKFDYVFVDEAQDTNAIQRALLHKVMHAKSRMVAVGDPAQAIYGFRGADSNSMDLIKKEFDCKSLPLHVSYRCPVNVVNYARQWVDHIEPAPGAPDGEVVSLGKEWKRSLTMFEPDDLIVCRTTKHLVATAFRLIRANIPARVMGREVGAGMKSLVRKMNAKDIDGLAEKLIVWRDREVEKAMVKQQDGKAENVHDQAGTLLFLIDNLKETNRTISDLLSTIEFLFAEGKGKVTLATIHKSKGLEAKRVYWLNRSTCPSKFAKQDWQKQQEINLCYVATTRAMDTLYLIED